MSDYSSLRHDMTERQMTARGIIAGRVIEAIEKVPREAFVPEDLREFAYEDTPLPIGEQQTISQPYIVALMTQAAEVGPADRVLEVGTGSGYGAAVLGALGAEVYTVERHASLAQEAGRRLDTLGYRNVHVRHGDGTQGWPEAAPFDAIIVTAGGPEIPPALREQLAEGGRLVIPVGPEERVQQLTKLIRIGPDSFEEEDLGPVRFVPLVAGAAENAVAAAPSSPGESSLPDLVAEAAEPFETIEDADLAPLLERIGDARIVLIGEASHGTSEFYRMRQRITRALIEHKGFRIIAAEADWPDAARIDHYVRQLDRPASEWIAFARFPTWMWRNHEVRGFVDWLHERNAGTPEDKAGFYGLDLYSLSTSIAAVVEYLDEVDPDSAAIARERYGCLSPWQADPATYGRMALSDRYRACAGEVVAMLTDLLEKRLESDVRDGVRLFDATANARLVANAERYYRSMYLSSRESWNLRDAHMFDTLRALVDAPEAPGGKAVVWAHNSHVGDARATAMSARGEHNIGQLCREAWGEATYILGFGTHAGTVAAADNWDAPMRIKQVKPSHRESYEHVCHDSGVGRFVLPLRGRGGDRLDRALDDPRLERAIGVIYRPDTELASHYFEAVLPEQFDEYVWFDRSEAVTPLATADLGGVPDTYPFGE